MEGEVEEPVRNERHGWRRPRSIDLAIVAVASLLAGAASASSAGTAAAEEAAAPAATATSPPTAQLRVHIGAEDQAGIALFPDPLPAFVERRSEAFAGRESHYVTTTSQHREDLLCYVRTLRTPAGTTLVVGGGGAAQDPPRSYLIEATPLLTNDNVIGAIAEKTAPPVPDELRSRAERAGPVPSGPRHQVVVSLGPDGAARLAEVSARSINKRAIILLDGKVRNTPWIRSRIPGGTVPLVMNENDDLASAEALARALTPITPEAPRTDSSGRRR